MVLLLRRYIGLFLLLALSLLIIQELVTVSTPPCLESGTFVKTEPSLDIVEALIQIKTNSQSSEERYQTLVRKDLEEISNHNDNIFTRHRLKLWFSGRCIARSDSDKLEVSHCNPDWSQSFSLTKSGLLRFDRTASCVVLDTSRPNTLEFGSCEDDNPVIFSLGENRTLQATVDEETLCLNPVTEQDMEVVNKISCLGSPLALAPCDEYASRLEIVSEEDFQVDRQIFKSAVTPSDSPNCDFKACHFNKPADPVQVLTPLYYTPCQSVYDCVTVVTKTARRPYLVTRLAQSIRDTKGYDLRIISYDDGPNDYPSEVWAEIGRYPQLQYIVGEDEDMGISLGRNLALSLVRTKYFLLLDDDHVFNDRTNLTKMMEVLDRTDAALVGGKFEGFMKFAGALKFGNYHNRQEFGVFSGLCERNITEFPRCEQCDSTSNVFMANTEVILSMGGWTEELKIVEHADFFLKLKALGHKVVYCDDIEVINQQESREERTMNYQKLRYDQGRKNRMFRLMNSRYNVNGLFWCSAFSVLDSGEIQCLETKHKIGYC